MKAYAIAIHIPMVLWAVAGFLIGSHLLVLGTEAALLLTCVTTGIIYLVERLIIATPKSWYVSAGRFVIGIVMALIGAATIDLVVFEREVAMQLRQGIMERTAAEHDAGMRAAVLDRERARNEWLTIQAAANCEANGTCGSGTRNVGPIYRELSRQVELLRQDYERASAKLERLRAARAEALAYWRDSNRPLVEAGLLARVEALHQYTRTNQTAFAAWLLFFVLILFFELIVVLVKLAFPATVDDQIDAIREEVSYLKAHNYKEALTSPLARARSLIESVP